MYSAHAWTRPAPGFPLPDILVGFCLGSHPLIAMEDFCYFLFLFYVNAEVGDTSVDGERNEADDPTGMAHEAY